MDKLTEKIALKIYKLIRNLKNGSELGKQQNMLSGLFPGKNKEQLLQNYYISKIKKVILASIAAFILTALAFINEISNSPIDDRGRIERADYGSSEYSTILIAQTDEEEIPIDVTVKERKYTKNQITDLFGKACDELETVILGENSSLDHVTKNLNLVSSLDSYPFQISWESKYYDLIHDDGEVFNNSLDQEYEQIQLLCKMLYDEYQFEKIYTITLFQKEKTKQEEIEGEIIASIQEKQKETINEEYLQLPMSVSNKGISWKMSSRSTVAFMAILSCMTLIGIWWGVDNDLTKKYKRRDQLLRLEYSEFVSKLQLLISSGMTLRGALERMEADYKYSLKEGEKEKYVYEELSICMKRLRDGASETEVYMIFGNRVGQMTYKKLMTLLVQNLKKGTAGLVDALSYEAKSAFEERKHYARRLGDEAQTKLLFPMILMLAVVMIIIIVPAYFSFGIQ